MLVQLILYWGMAMAREAWPNALNVQLFNSKVGVYFRGGLFPWEFISYLKWSGIFFREGFFSATGKKYTLYGAGFTG